MKAREHILQRIRMAGSGKAETQPGHSRIVPAKPLPPDQASLLAMFADQARAVGTNVELLQAVDQLPGALPDFAEPLAIADAQLVSEFNTIGVYATEGEVLLVQASAAIAETGSVCVHSGQVPSRSLFLCEHLLVLINSDCVVPCLEDYWRAVDPSVTRALHVISGPSRTADVEQTIQIGAHGPRSMSCFVIMRHVS